MNKESKKDVEKGIRNFFKEKHCSKDVKKIKRLAMRHQIKLRELRKKFCKKCYSMNLKVLGIKNKIKRVRCENCNNIVRYKIKN